MTGRASAGGQVKNLETETSKNFEAKWGEDCKRRGRGGKYGLIWFN